MDSRQKYNEELRNREIAPSHDSWDRLSNKLDAHDSVNNRKIWVLFRYAAAILLLVSVGFYYFGLEETIEVNPVVNSPKIEIPSNDPVENFEKPKTEVASRPNQDSSSPEKKEQFQQRSVKNKTTNGTLIVEKIALHNPPPIVIESSVESESKSVLSESNTITEPKVEQLINVEIDQLLNNSRKELLGSEQKLAKTTVNANALLHEVEDDIDSDLKERIFKTISKMINNPKVASSNKK